MKTRRKKIYVALLLLLVTWLMTGLAVDDEFYDEYRIFLKHRPTGQFYFRSPLGMQDMPLDYPVEKIAAYDAYHNFVIERHWSSELDGLAIAMVIGTFCYSAFVFVRLLK